MTMAMARPLSCNHKNMQPLLLLLHTTKPTFMSTSPALQIHNNYDDTLQSNNNNGQQWKTPYKQVRMKEALRILHNIVNQNQQLDSSTYISLLRDCVKQNALPEARLVHAHIIISGFKPNVSLETKLVVMYGKCVSSLVDARHMLDEMPERRNVVTWTAMIGAYSRNGKAQEALTLFCQMQRTGIDPDDFTYASVLPACASLAALDYGRELHQNIIRSGFQCDKFVASALGDMYFKCGSIEDACKVFDKTPERDTVSWNTMIAGYTQNGLIEEALKIFQEMPEPNRVSWNTMIVGYAQIGNVEEALQFFQKMPERDVFAWNAMIAGYVQAGCVDEAVKLFQEMPDRDVVSWNQMIVGYAQNGRVDEAMELFQKMPGRDMISWNTMITGYVQNGYVEEALELFHAMPERGVISWNSMIAGYAQNGHFNEALQLFHKMHLTGVKPNTITFASVLSACANLAALVYGKAVHEYVIKSGFQSDTFVGNALVDMYAKCGSIEVAQNVFDKMPAPDIVSWNAIIVGCAMHGFGKEALQLFEKMEHSSMKPNHVTFLGVLSACCHAGLLDHGWRYFNRMSQFYHITPAVEHYCCMADLLGRAGQLDEAYDLINKMPIKPTAAVWASLLGACRIHSNIELGERVADCLFHSDSKNAGHFVLLSNIYAAAGRWDDVEKVRKMMKERSVVKTPGCSWIEVNNKMYAFLVGDRSNPQTQKIYAELERLSGQMKEGGYVPDKGFALHDVEEEQKEHILGYHSEKLAVVFGLINISPEIPIRVIKNLRVCGDCHSAIKFISKIAAREIVVRDGIRFHHFSNGQCSCGDYW